MRMLTKQEVLEAFGHLRGILSHGATHEFMQVINALKPMEACEVLDKEWPVRKDRTDKKFRCFRNKDRTGWNVLRVK